MTTHPTFIHKLWLLFAQVVTACLALLFLLRLFFPQLLNQPSQTVVVKEVSQTNLVPKISSYSMAAQRAMPAVVNIFTSKKALPNPHQRFLDDPAFRQFFGDQLEGMETQSQPDNSLGSGVIVSEQGLILTNNHVIATADAIEIALADGRKLPATVIGTDPESDLALIKIEAMNLPAITFASSDAINVGDIVLAIGNPFGVGQTVTQGIVSALGRNHLGINTFENFIQTDASINPGNSGGALIDVVGNLVGVNSAIYSRNGGSMGIGFAIPAKLAKQVMEQIITQGSVTRGWIGIEAQDITAELAESFRLSQVQGSLIAGVLAGGPAARAGLKAGDILLKINNSKVFDSASMLNIISVLPPNKSAILTISRAQKLINIPVVIGRRPTPEALNQ